MILKTAAVVFGFLVALSAGTVSAADLHPIIEIETGYFFGASENGKWVKPEEAAKSVANKTTYQVYSLTKQVGQITAAKPTSVEEPRPDTLMVSLLSGTHSRKWTIDDWQCDYKKRRVVVSLVSAIDCWRQCLVEIYSVRIVH